MRGDIYREPRRIAKSDRVKEDWINRVRGIRHSKKETVVGMTFAQAEVSFARDHNWQYPPRGLPEMPLNPADWFRPIQSVPKERLSR
jgi:hypothetical protein